MKKILKKNQEKTSGFVPGNVCLKLINASWEKVTKRKDKVGTGWSYVIINLLVLLFVER